MKAIKTKISFVSQMDVRRYDVKIRLISEADNRIYDYIFKTTKYDKEKKLYVRDDITFKKANDLCLKNLKCNLQELQNELGKEVVIVENKNKIYLEQELDANIVNLTEDMVDNKVYLKLYKIQSEEIDKNTVYFIDADENIYKKNFWFSAYVNKRRCRDMNAYNKIQKQLEQIKELADNDYAAATIKKFGKNVYLDFDDLNYAEYISEKKVGYVKAIEKKGTNISIYIQAVEDADNYLYTIKLSTKSDYTHQILEEKFNIDVNNLQQAVSNKKIEFYNHNATSSFEEIDEMKYLNIKTISTSDVMFASLISYKVDDYKDKLKLTIYFRDANNADNKKNLRQAFKYYRNKEDLSLDKKILDSRFFKIAKLSNDLIIAANN